MVIALSHNGTAGNVCLHIHTDGQFEDFVDNIIHIHRCLVKTHRNLTKVRNLIWSFVYSVMWL